MNELDKDQINLEGFDFTKKKQLVKDPAKNKLMNEFIDKYVQLIDESKGPEEEKVTSYNKKEETFDVLGALHATQVKQKQQKRINYIIEDPDEMPAELYQLKKEENFKRVKERHSQSMANSPEKTKDTLNVKKKSKHRRTESINLDNKSVKKIMSMDFNAISDGKLLFENN